MPEIYATSDESREFPIHCVRDTPGWALVVDPDAVDPAIPRYRIEKGVFDMWAEPDIRVERIGSAESWDRDAFFSTLREDGIEEVIVVGVAADYCVRWAVEGLIERGFRVAIPATLTRGIARQIDQTAADEWSGKAVAVLETV